MNKILVLGAGELGQAIIDYLLAHQAYSPNYTPITLLVRPSSLQRYKHLESRGISLIAEDLYTANVSKLSATFTGFTTVIHAGNMAAPDGTQLKITHAVLQAKIPLYLPWQFGVDYDIITREGGEGMFSEAIDVRDTLRAQDQTRWLIISCGIFMSFLFEPYWGVVERDKSGKVTTVHALGSWEDNITVTDAADIGKCTAELVLDENALQNQPVYIAGETLTYTKFADVVEKVVGGNVLRDLWSTEHLKKEYAAAMDEEKKLRKYRVVFSEGVGLSWAMEQTWNREKGVQMEGVESWFRRNYGNLTV